jgi:L-threonylcarbamoyladenylate synthase
MITTDFNIIISCLNRGELVGIPTETVYGLAANIYNENALSRIFETKKRPSNNPLIVHVSSIEEAKSLVIAFPPKAEILAKHFWPGSLTLILPKNDQISPIISAHQATVAIRVPNHASTLELLSQLDFPLAAPSANPYNRISPTSAAHVEGYFPSIYTLDGGPCESGLESTIVGFEGEEVILLRHGAISIEELEAVVGKIGNRTDEEGRPISPGLHKKHYSPTCDLIVSTEPLFLLSAIQHKKVAILWFQEVKIWSEKVDVNLILSPEGNLEEAAQHLFSYLHQLEKSGVDLIIAERLPDMGLGRTLNDRLDRAASKG